ncbi:MAG: HlyD family secretion protein [Pseudomonadota bacterium]
MKYLARFLRRLFRVGLLILGPVAIAIAGAWFYMSSGRYVTTENAYVKSDLVFVTAEISGRVTEVAIADNQPVAPGDLLFRIDRGRKEVERAMKDAELSAARQRVSALKARYRTKLAEYDAAEADLDFLREELERSERLRKGGTISQIRLIEVRRQTVRAESSLSVLREEAEEVLAELNGQAELDIDTHPEVMRAKAELEEADLDLRLTEVRAPSGGVIANLQLQTGEYVSEGDPVMSLVADKGYWVEANLKETDLTHLRIGQRADLAVDAYPGVTWAAEVDTMSPATGAEYALLPPQNASGNWVKVVQRVPVRLRILPEAGAPPLRAGMSVAVSIDTGYERPLPDVVAKARAWILPEARE